MAATTPRSEPQPIWSTLLAKKSGGVLKRPRRTHTHKDAVQSQEFKNSLARRLWSLHLPKERSVRVWAIDEHRYGLISHQRRCWAMRRVRPHAPYRTRYEWGYVASALEIEGRDEGLCVFLPGVNKASSAAFLQEIAKADPESIHVIIQDQAGFHLKESEESLPENVRLLPLPPYSPELNPVERMGDLMKDATGNRAFESLEAMEQALEAELKPFWTDPQRVRDLVGHGWIRVQVNAFSD